MRYQDRTEAGRLLAERLAKYKNRPDVVILALPRGGVPVGFEVAQALNAPLDVFVVRKLGVPGQEELAMGAIASGGVLVLNEDIVQMLRIPYELIEATVVKEVEELERRERLYRGDRPRLDARDRVAILIDDGLATGSTMRAAARALRLHQPSRVVVAAPVAAGSTCDELSNEVDEVICAETPEPFYAISLWYRDFTQTTDDQVRELLAQSARPIAA